jgi:hypothetical protein
MEIVFESNIVILRNLDMSAIEYHGQTMLERCHMIPVMVRPILDLPLLLPIKPARHWRTYLYSELNRTMDKVSFSKSIDKFTYGARGPCLASQVGIPETTQTGSSYTAACDIQPPTRI